MARKFAPMSKLQYLHSVEPLREPRELESPNWMNIHVYLCHTIHFYITPLCWSIHCSTKEMDWLHGLQSVKTGVDGTNTFPWINCSNVLYWAKESTNFDKEIFLCIYIVHILWFSSCNLFFSLSFLVLGQPRLQAILLNWCFKTCMAAFCTKLFTRLINYWRIGLIKDNERERSRRTSALYILIRPWLTLDQEGTALMFHSWLECSANGPVFIYRTEKEWQRRGEEGQVRHVWCNSSTL